MGSSDINQVASKVRWWFFWGVGSFWTSLPTPFFLIYKGIPMALTPLENEPGFESVGFTAQLTNETAEKLVMLKRWMNTPTYNRTLFILIRDAFNLKEAEQMAKMENRPLVSLGQGEYRRDINEEDC